MKTSIHRKIRMIKYTSITIFGYFFQKTNIVIHGKAKIFDKITAFLLLYHKIIVPSGPQEQKDAMVKMGRFLPLKAQTAPNIKDLEY